MSTSGTTSFNYTTNQIITKALQLLGIIAPGEVASAEDYSACLDNLNMMVKGWESKGIFVHTQTQGTVFLNVGQQSYVLGAGSTDHVATGTVVETNLTVAENAAATVLTVTSTSNMNINDNIGVQLDSEVLFWSTIVSINSSTSVTMAAGLPSVASDPNFVYTFTTTIGRALDIDNMQLRRNGGTDYVNQDQLADFPIYGLSRETYFNTPNKGVSAMPYQYYVDKQATNTILYVYPANDTCSNRLKFTYRRIFQDFTNPSDVADFPQEWVECLCYNLAVRISPIYDKEVKVSQQAATGATIATQAMDMFKELLGHSIEKNSLKISPRLNWFMMK